MNFLTHDFPTGIKDPVRTISAQAPSMKCSSPMRQPAELTQAELRQIVLDIVG